MIAPAPLTATEIADSLSRIIHPEQITELRALNCGGPRLTTAGWFDGRHLFDLARTALSLTRSATAVYFIPNPVHPNLHARCPNRVENVRRDKFKLTTDADILERRYLFVDLDCDREDGNSAQPTNSLELSDTFDAAALTVGDFVFELGFQPPIQMMSGNGYHLLFPLSSPLPNEPSSNEPDPLREALALFRRWHFRLKVRVDPNTYTAARMLKVPGTIVRKGVASADRPFRMAYITEIPNGWKQPEPPPAGTLPPSHDARPGRIAAGGNERKPDDRPPAIVKPDARSKRDRSKGGRLFESYASVD
jgi:hypothetical protein